MPRIPFFGMKTKLKTTRVLLIDTLLIVLLAIAFVSTNLYLTNHVQTSLKAVDEKLEIKLDTVLKMGNVARERSDLMLSMYNETDDWKIDDEFQRFHKLVLDFIQLREKLEASGLSELESKLLNSALKIIKITEPLQNDIVDRIQSGHLENVAADISQKDIPLEIELLGVFEQLSKQILHDAIATRDKIQQQFYQAVTLVALISALIIIGLIALMFRSLKKIQKIEMGLLIETENLSWDATHDPLTNTYNRRWLKHKVTSLLEANKQSDDVHSIIYMDLDGFKNINDDYGHFAGDQYLQAVCRKIESCIRQNDILARIGGDEFAILLTNCELSKAQIIADQILEMINHFVHEFEGNRLSAGCSIGAYEFSGNESGFEEIIREADQLCYLSKKEGKNRITVKKIA